MTRVIFIAGASRSGSTLLDLLLGSTGGVASLGEVHNVWDRGFQKNHYCGCGRRVAECPVWKAIRLQVLNNERIGVDEILDSRARSVRTRLIRNLLRQRLGASGLVYCGHLSRLFRAAGDSLGVSTLVDSSKRPAHGAMLLSVPGIELSVIHLVRDSRAMAFSATKVVRKSDGEDGELMARLSPRQSATGWLQQNLLSELLCRAVDRSVRVRYEDLAADPVRTLGEIGHALGIALDTPNVDEGRVAVHTAHTVSGNPMRLTEGTITIKADEKWRSALSAKDHRLVSALTWPLLRRYGYQL